MTTPIRKPLRRRVTPQIVPHGVKPQLIITLYPGGTIGIREAGRRHEVFTSVGKLYVQLLKLEISERRRSA